MNKSLIASVVGVLVLLVGVWCWSVRDNSANQVTSEQSLATNVYRDTALGFSVTLPTALSSTTNETLFAVDTSYSYEAMGPGKPIEGVRFTIPSGVATGTNLSSDSYLSIEHLGSGVACNATAFLGLPTAQSVTIKSGTLSYSFASTTGAAAGNRYEEYVYALSNTNPCVAVRYFIHSGAFQNYPEGAVKEFDKSALIAEFDAIRQSLVLSK